MLNQIEITISAISWGQNSLNDRGSKVRNSERLSRLRQAQTEGRANQALPFTIHAASLGKGGRRQV